MSDLFSHYRNYKPRSPKHYEEERHRLAQELIAKKQNAEADKEAARLAKKAARHQANLEAFREKVTNSDWPDDEKASLIAKSYLW